MQLNKGVKEMYALKADLVEYEQPTQLKLMLNFLVSKLQLQLKFERIHKHSNKHR